MSIYECLLTSVQYFLTLFHFFFIRKKNYFNSVGYGEGDGGCAVGSRIRVSS